MDSDNFFGFDSSLPVEDNDDDGEVDDDEYDALNDETFGSAAVGGDWEENHKQLSSLTEAERLRRSAEKNVNYLNARHNDINFQLEKLHNKESFQKTLGNISLHNNTERKRLYERSVNSSPLIDLHKDDLSSSPGNSIWSPTLGLEQAKNLSQLNKPIVNNASILSNSFNTQSLHNEPQHYKQMGMPSLQDLNIQGLNLRSSVKTVSEIEEELRRQHVPDRQHNINKYSSSDLQRQLERQISLEKLNRQQISSSSSYLGVRGPSNNPNSLHHPFMNNHENYLKLQAQLHHTSGNFKSHGHNNMQNMQNALHYTHPMLNNRILPPGFVSNASNLFNRPFNSQMNQRPPNLMRGGMFPNGGNCGIRNMNMNRNNMERKMYDQNNYDHMRNSHDQREKNNQCGNRVRRDSDAEWEEWQRIRQDDEYAGLMTPREKGWLRNIQAMQLQPANPYQDDYYFVMYSLRQQRGRQEEVTGDGLQLLVNDNLLHNVKLQRKREDEVVLDDLQVLLHDKGKEGKEYEPPRLENSLGKLQVVSVNAPRKIIDLEVVHPDSSQPTTILQRDMRKHRYLLLHIEKLYNVQMELDDLERKIRALPDCPTRDLFRSKCRQLVSKLWTDLINPHESFVQLLCIRKGKTLVTRLLNWVGEPEVEHILATVIQNLTIITKKDANDKKLPLFWPYADRFFSCCSSSTLVSFGIMMEPQFKDTRWIFPALISRLGVSLVLRLLICGEKYYNELDKDENWQAFLIKVATCLANDDKGKDIMPLPSITLSRSAQLPAKHLARCSELDSTIMIKSLEILKSFEDYLIKSFPSNPSTSTLNHHQTTAENKSQRTEHAQPDSHFLFCNSDASNKTPKPIIEIF